MAGVLKVCANVFRAIDENTSFSVFQLAKEARNQHPKIFQEMTDYELYYLLTHTIWKAINCMMQLTEKWIGYVYDKVLSNMKFI
ncbi:Hypothetical predicted protein [Mytilus galloprovincialis]|uniref:Uncharacterized protein n=1 Tax=Mytilus galloprovincialis TaxID=29158 RepID=A0A8B6HTE8_MYTGA|nr:Hypothetical predicted protein [Mytilus galloprovincialis]